MCNVSTLKLCGHRHHRISLPLNTVTFFLQLNVHRGRSVEDIAHPFLLSERLSPTRKSRRDARLLDYATYPGKSEKSVPVEKYFANFWDSREIKVVTLQKIRKHHLWIIK